MLSICTYRKASPLLLLFSTPNRNKKKNESTYNHLNVAHSISSNAVIITFFDGVLQNTPNMLLQEWVQRNRNFRCGHCYHQLFVLKIAFTFEHFFQ